MRKKKRILQLKIRTNKMKRTSPTLMKSQNKSTNSMKSLMS